MPFIFDNLATTFVALIVALVLANIQLRTNQNSVEQSALYQSRKQTLELADMLTRDLSNMGYGVLPVERIASHTTNAGGMTDTLMFRRDDGAGTTIEIEYVLAVADTVVIDDEDVVLYQLERYQDGTLNGQSLSTLRSFEIDLLDEDSNVVADLSDTRQVRITLTNVISIGDIDTHYMPETNWSTTLRPQGLQ